MMTKEEMIREIQKLKKEKDAVILVHNYQLPEIQDIADILGDSLDLSRKAATIENNMIVFCGVQFMAESAKLLSPDKTVLIPRADAGCAMADMVDKEGLLKFKADHPNAKVVAYVNTTAETKSITDVCCTSANAVKIIQNIQAEEIIFVPDKNLGSYVAKFTDKKVHLWPGFCYVHDQYTIEDVKNVREKYPEANFIVHPESPAEVVELADSVESTSGMIRFAKETDAKELIIGTEIGMLYRLQKEVPDKKFYPLKEDAICKSMKLTRLEDVYLSLKEERYPVVIDINIANRAKHALEKMLELS